MTSWKEFAEMRGDLAEQGRAMFYQFGVGLAFLATVRKDGGPRVHPMCPIITGDGTGDGLYALIVPSPKREDLIRDGRYAMHAFPTESNEDAFYVAGRATLVGDPAVRALLVKQFCAERGDMDPQRVTVELPFSFDVETCLLTRTTGHGDWNPRHTIWNAP